jgi:hypothetical protein
MLVTVADMWALGLGVRLMLMTGNARSDERQRCHGQDSNSRLSETGQITSLLRFDFS